MLPLYGGQRWTAASDQSNKGSPLGTPSIGSSTYRLTHAKACQCVHELDQGIDIRDTEPMIWLQLPDIGDQLTTDRVFHGDEVVLATYPI